MIRLLHLLLAAATGSYVAAAAPTGLPLWGFTVVAVIGATATVFDSAGAWSTGTVGTLVLQYVVGALSSRSSAPGVWVLYALVAGVYLVHATAALAASLPARARVEPAVLGRWLLRTGGICLATLPLVLAVGLFRPGQGHVGWIALGVVAAAALVLLPALTFRRRV